MILLDSLDLKFDCLSFVSTIDNIMSEILILRLSLANLYPPLGPLEATKIRLLTNVWSVCSRYLFGIHCRFAIDSFLTGSSPEFRAISKTASIA